MEHKYLRTHPERSITDRPLNAHAELTLEGWFLVGGWRTAYPEPPEGAVDLYAKDAKGTQVAWLISTDPDAATWDEFQRFCESPAEVALG